MMDSIPEALMALRSGKPVLVLDDESRENEGDVIIAGHSLTQEWMGWLIRHTSGYVCAPMPDEIADRLNLPIMVANSQDQLRTAYTITCDAAAGTTTGISAHDRALTVRLLADPDAQPSDFNRPGHVVPLRARQGGVLTRPGHTEACVDLCRLAGLPPVGAIGELVHDDGSMMRTPDVVAFGTQEELPVITIADLVRYRHVHDRVRLISQTTLPTEHGIFELRCYADDMTDVEHVAMISPRGCADGALVRVHSECLTGDILGSLRCDCGPQLAAATAKVAAEGGAVIYLRGHEGRGVGLGAKLAAYHLQDQGLDTVDAQTALGLPIDAREYGAAAGILHDLGLSHVTLLTNNPDKDDALTALGFTIDACQPVIIEPNPANVFYLHTKRDRMGHRL